MPFDKEMKAVLKALYVQVPPSDSNARRTAEMARQVKDKMELARGVIAGAGWKYSPELLVSVAQFMALAYQNALLAELLQEKKSGDD